MKKEAAIKVLSSHFNGNPSDLSTKIVSEISSSLVEAGAKPPFRIIRLGQEDPQELADENEAEAEAEAENIEGDSIPLNIDKITGEFTIPDLGIEGTVDLRGIDMNLRDSLDTTSANEISGNAEINFQTGEGVFRPNNVDPNQPELIGSEFRITTGEPEITTGIESIEAETV